MFLNDAELHQLVDPPAAVITGLDPNRVAGSKEDPVQPASIDLTIGGIFVPGEEPGKYGSAGFPRSSLSLDRGETAVIETAQTCRLPPTIGAIGFPPTSVSAKGLLTTNPGHVDPGYHGKLSFTVINMGSEPYPLALGADIVSLLLFRLTAPAVAPYDQRYGAGPHGAVDTDRLARLSRDFLDIKARAKQAAESAESKTRRMAFAVPIAVAVLALAGVYMEASRANQDEINQLKEDVTLLQGKLELEKRVAKLEAAR